MDPQLEAQMRSQRYADREELKMLVRQENARKEKMNIWHENRLYEIRYTDGTTTRVESTNEVELKEKALSYYKARNGEVDFHWVQIHSDGTEVH